MVVRRPHCDDAARSCKRGRGAVAAVAHVPIHAGVASWCTFTTRSSRIVRRVAGWQICAVIVDADQRAVLVDGPGGPDSAPRLADAGSPSQPFRVPTVSLPRGTSPESTAPLDALEALLGRQVVPLWMRDVEVAREEQSGVMVVLAAGDVAADATAGRHFVEAAIAIEALEPAITRPVVRRCPYCRLKLCSMHEECPECGAG